MGQFGYRGRALAFFGTVIAAAAVACTDAPTQPQNGPQPPSDIGAATAVAMLEARLAFPVDTGVIRVAPLRGAAKYEANEHGGDWTPTGKLVADSAAYSVSSLAPNGPAGKSAKRSSIGFSRSAPGLKVRNNDPKQVKIVAMPVVNGHVPTVLIVAGVDAKHGEPPRITVLLVDGIPVMATERQYRHSSGSWVTASEVATLFDSSGKQVASVRTDSRQGHGKKATSQIDGQSDAGDGMLAELSALSGVADAVVRVAGNLITPASLYAQESVDCSSLYYEMMAAISAAAAAALAAKDAAIAAAPWVAACAGICFFDPLTCAFTPVCIEAAQLTATAAVLAAAAYYAGRFAQQLKDKYQKYCCPCLGGTAELGSTGGAVMSAAPESGARARKAMVSVSAIDLSHIDRAGRWVHESLNLKGHHAAAPL